MPTRDVIFNIIGRDEATPAVNRAASSFEAGATRISRAGEKMSAAGRKWTHTVTLPLLALGAASVKTSVDFNAAMTRIQTQAGGSARDVRVLSGEVLNLAKYAQQGPGELADALYHLKSVGMANVPAMRALRQASDLAAVGHANLEETTNALAGAWRTGIRGAQNFHQAVASLNAIIGSGNMKMEDLNAALGTGILPTAKTFGLTLRDVGAALALFTDEGVPADAAATRLRMTFSLLAAPTGKAQEQLANIGLTQYRLANDMRKPNGLLVAITDLKKHLDASGLSATEQAALLSRAFGGGRSSSALLSMVNNLDVLGQKYDQQAHLITHFDQAVKAQRQTAAAQLHLLESSLQRSAVLIGNDVLPVVLHLAHGFGAVAEAFNKLSPRTRHLIVDSALLAAALGPVMSITGRLAIFLPRLWRVFTLPQRVLLGWGTAGRAVTATGTAAETTSARMTLAARETQAAQLSEQAAAERAAAVVTVAEANKAKAAAEGAAITARALSGTESILAQNAIAASKAADEFAIAMNAQASAAVKSAATITVASEQATRALGREQVVAARARAVNRRAGLGFGLGIGLTLAGSQTSGRTSSALTGAGTGALIGSMVPIPGAPLIGAGVGGAIGAFKSDNSAVGMAHRVNDIKAALDKLNPSVRDTVKNATGFKEAWARAVAGSPQQLNRLVVSAEHTDEAAKRAQASAHNLSRYFKTEGDQASITGAKIISLADAISGLDHGMLNLASNQIQFQLGLKDLPGQFDKNSKAIFGNTRAALTNRQALVGLLQQVQAHASAMQEAGRKAPAVERAIDGDVASLERVATKAGVSKTAFERLIAEMHLTPKQVHTEIVADTERATTAIERLQNRIKNLHGKQLEITVTQLVYAVNARNRLAANVLTPASGGYISGAGTGTSDSIPAMVSNGEYVVNARATARHRSLLDSINRGTPAYAAGGPVHVAHGTGPRRMKIEGGTLTLEAGGKKFNTHIQDLILAELDY